ncbi:MAG: TonB-dependent receptor [Bacteroidales bacterium]|nr:TonB-dependent receptor [Bacteroidales bacterium]
MKKKLIFVVVLSLIVNWTLTAQNLTGRVVEVNEDGDTSSVYMASLQWLHTSQGTITGTDGTFSLPYANTDTLVISFPTYQPDTMKVGRNQKDITIVLSHAHSLSEVSIVSRDGSYISTQPILTTVISQQGLRRAACCNLAESFESTVAVDMEYSDAITGARQISMLGLASVYSQILLENVPFIRILTHQFGLGFVPGAWMESISISKGVASVTNGYEAITGQINVDYKKPETNYERVFLNLYGNSMGKGELNFNSRFKVGKKDNVSSILMLYAGDQFAKIDMNKDGFLDVPRNQQINVMNRWDYDVPGIMEGRTMVDFVWDNRVGGQKEYDWHENLYSNEIYGLHIDNKKLDVITKNGFLLKGEDESIGTILSYTSHFTNAVFGLKNFDAWQNSLYANVLYSNKFGQGKHHKLTAGGSLQYDNYREDVYMFGEEPGALPSNEVVPGIFAEYCYIIDPKLVLMAGLRLDYNTLFNQLFWTPRVHLKWQAAKNTFIRASAGKGYRTTHVLAENIGLLTSNRNYYELETNKPEEAYNAGVSIVQSFNVPGGKASVAVDYFYTHFLNQTIIDLDRDAHGIYVYNLNGVTNGIGNISRSHSAQIEVTLKPFQRFELIFAYRYNDVKYQSNGLMREKVLMSPHKGLFNVNYSTRYDKWKFNVTLQVNGPQRLPDMAGNTAANLPAYSPTYCMLNAQITKKFRHWEVYVGGENLLNYKQANPIIAANDPFGDNFDATVVYAPITGIMGYVGFRYVLK